MEAVSSSCNDSRLGLEGYAAFSYLLIFLILMPVFVINLVLFVALINFKAIPKPVRIVLVNIILGSLVVIVGLLLTHLPRIILVHHYSLTETFLEPSEYACRVALWIIASGGGARLLLMSMYASLIFVIVSKGTKSVKIWAVFLGAACLWAITVGFNSMVLSPRVVTIEFLDRVVCTPHTNTNSTGLSYFYGGFYFVVFGFVSFAIGIVMPLLALYYIKKRSVTGNIKTKKVMSKFGLFLLIGNIVNILGQAVPILFALFTPSGTSEATCRAERAITYVQILLLHLSLLPTPILLLIYFKHLRRRVRTCCRYNFYERGTTVYNRRHTNRNGSNVRSEAVEAKSYARTHDKSSEDSVERTVDDDHKAVTISLDTNPQP